MAAISPEDFCVGESDCASVEDVPTDTSVTNAAEQIAIRSMWIDPKRAGSPPGPLACATEKAKRIKNRHRLATHAQAFAEFALTRNPMPANGCARDCAGQGLDSGYFRNSWLVHAALLVAVRVWLTLGLKPSQGSEKGDAILFGVFRKRACFQLVRKLTAGKPGRPAAVT